MYKYNIWRIQPLGEPLHQFMNAFMDHRDSELLIVSHFSLLLGCALPIWMSSGFNDRALSPEFSASALEIQWHRWLVINMEC
ncbi:unnamed protein product [Thlaspi arvense]|uniref:dolichol kinase n=1 Tax=Thlaspi arvense TaxID=13288 RepID=A0AAU9SG53_THLAR|nr:unnamed protein product [Thlaspi arvense]